MSWHVNDSMFDDLNAEESDDLLVLARSIVLQGFVDIEHPAFVAFKCATNIDNCRQMLAYSTVFVQYALLSVLLHDRAQQPFRHEGSK